MHSKASKNGNYSIQLFDPFVESIKPSGIPKFFDDLPEDLGREKQQDEDDIDNVTHKKRKKRDTNVKDTLTEQGDMASKYYYGNYNLPLKYFGKPNDDYANRDFNIGHACDLVEHWSMVGMMFPDKAAIVCAFEVRPTYYIIVQPE